MLPLAFCNPSLGVILWKCSKQVTVLNSFKWPLLSLTPWWPREQWGFTFLKVIPGREVGIRTSFVQGCAHSTVQLWERFSPTKEKAALPRRKLSNASQHTWNLMKRKGYTNDSWLCKYWKAFSRQRKSYSTIMCIIIITVPNFYREQRCAVLS